MTRVYSYVGPPEIKARASGQSKGAEIQRPADVLDWARYTSQVVSRGGLLAATFVIVLGERLLIADRHSEHVACAGGGNVLAAGEMFFAIDGNSVAVEEVSNQSTGYCPEPESWPVVERVLVRAGIEHPAEFTTVCTFRRCPSCGERNIVKDSWFYCALCGHELPRQWNFDTIG